MGVRFPPRAPLSCTTIVVCAHLCRRIRHFCNLRSPLDFYFLHGPDAPVEAAIQSMSGRIRFVAREDWTGMDQGRQAIVIVRTIDGRNFEREVWHQPMTRLQLEEKCESLLTPRFGAKQATEIKALCDELGRARSIRPLMALLRG